MTSVGQKSRQCTVALREQYLPGGGNVLRLLPMPTVSDEELGLLDEALAATT